MRSPEVGHNKNVANFKSLYKILEEMGPLYNPTKPSIQMTELVNMHNQLLGLVAVFNEKNPLYKNAVAEREVNMQPFSKLITRVYRSFKASSESEPDIENVQSMARQLRGMKKPKNINPEEQSSESISTSRMSYDNRTANFEALIAFLETKPEYMPNEDDLKIVNLKAFNQLQGTLNESVNETANALDTARTARNRLLYKMPNGAVALADNVKDYLVSLGDDGKNYYKRAVRLKFRRY